MLKAIGLVAVMLAGPAQAADSGVVSSIDLTAPFHTHSPWVFTATQGAAVADPIGGAGDTVPGEISLCLSHDGKADCEPKLAGLLHSQGEEAGTGGAHYLNTAEVVYPDGPKAQPLLFLQVAGFPAPNNNRAVVTVALRYNAYQDRFGVVYQHLTGHNNNQDVRYIADGPLRGAIISAEPTENAPFAFWINVNRPGGDGTYHSDLLYRSATGYNDGNPLAVIDSEMVNIEGRLGLWHSGQPLPAPAGKCPNPHLVNGELWCQ